MPESKFRIWAKAVAIWKMTISLFAIIALCAVWILYNGQNEEQPEGDLGDVSRLLIDFTMLVAVGILAAYTWFSYNLLKATALGAEPSGALRKAKNWRVFAVAMVVLYLITMANLLQLTSQLIGFCVNILCIWIVHRYIEDLEIAVQENANTGPGGMRTAF